MEFELFIVGIQVKRRISMEFLVWCDDFIDKPFLACSWAFQVIQENSY